MSIVSLDSRYHLEREDSADAVTLLRGKDPNLPHASLRVCTKSVFMTVVLPMKETIQKLVLQA